MTEERAKNKGGRPSLKSDEVLARIYAGLEKGIPLTVICAPDDMPAPRTVWDWEQADADVATSIARAREIGEYALAEECLRIADTPMEGVSEKYEVVTMPNPDNPELGNVEEFKLTERKVEDMLGHRKLQIDTRLKLLAKFNPRRWGDYQRVDHDVVGNLAEDLKAARERASKG